MKPSLFLLPLLLLAGCAQFQETFAPRPHPPAAASASASAEPRHPSAPRDAGGLIAYDRELRRMSDAELAAELRKAEADRAGPHRSLRMGLVLLHGRSAAEAARAQGLFESVARSNEADAGQRALAQLLASACAELRRAWDQADGMVAQLRDSKRRSDQLAEQVEALKNIEQTLPSRSAGSAR
jgi:hypothetical protein